ncbi:MAG: hypothetical protein IT545_12730 [Rhodobacteraceae bacterium]|nr:hypothetical protein [Paracoccaceae bacterium]
MFTIEHEFDHTLITLVDEGRGRLREDIVVRAGDDRVEVEQYDPETDTTARLTFSFAQLEDLRAALDLPEGVYRRRPPGAPVTP